MEDRWFQDRVGTSLPADSIPSAVPSSEAKYFPLVSGTLKKKPGLETLGKKDSKPRDNVWSSQQLGNGYLAPKPLLDFELSKAHYLRVLKGFERTPTHKALRNRPAQLALAIFLILSFDNQGQANPDCRAVRIANLLFAVPSNVPSTLCRYSENFLSCHSKTRPEYSPQDFPRHNAQHHESLSSYFPHRGLFVDQVTAQKSYPFLKLRPADSLIISLKIHGAPLPHANQQCKPARP